jgi:S1-C subfamily serine protease
MLVGMTFGFLLVVTIGIASADETPTSYPASPDVELVPAAVVAAGADSIDLNAVARMTTYGRLVHRGTAFQLDDGRIGTVAHALIDARRANVGSNDSAIGLPLGADGEDEHVATSRLHDLSAVSGRLLDSSLSVADQPAVVGQQVALAGVPGDGRIQVLTGTVIARTSGVDYGVGRPDVYVIAAAVDQGWSGGPVVDSNGDVVAVIVGVEQRSGVTLAVPIEYLPMP